VLGSPDGEASDLQDPKEIAMTIPHVLGFTFLALVLLFTSVVARGNGIWSNASSPTFAWFCHALAASFAIVGATCVLCQCAPGRIAPAASKRVTCVAAIVVAVGLVIDNWGQYGGWRFWIGVAEWVGFVVLLALCFDVARRADALAGS
jgi:hypothetical protein